MNIKILVVVGVIVSLCLGGLYIRNVIADNALLEQQVKNLKDEKKALEEGLAKAQAASVKWQGDYNALKIQYRKLNADLDHQLARDPSAACVLSDDVLRQLDASIAAASK